MENILKQVEQEHGWSPDYSRKVWTEYVKFLSLRNKDPKLSPSNEIDKLWHQHILNTKSYREFCFKYYGKFIDHDPEDANDQPARIRRLDNTIKNYNTLFKKSPPDNIWNRRDSINVYIIYAFDTYKDGQYISKRPKNNSGYKYDRKIIQIPFTGDIKKEVSRVVAGDKFEDKPPRDYKFSVGFDVYLFNDKEDYIKLLDNKKFSELLSFGNHENFRGFNGNSPIVAVLEEMTHNGYC